MPHSLRRHLAALAVAMVAATGLVTLISVGPAGATMPTPVVRKKVIGYSVRGRPIIAYELGNPYSARKRLILGEMHGDEPAGVTVAKSIINGSYAVSGVDLWVIPTMNPDGYARGTRQNAHGVDLNRNWPDHWAALTGMYYSGPQALSEPETKAMYAFLKWLRPHYFVSLHQPLHGVDTTDGGATHPAFRDRLATNLGLPEKAFNCWSVCHGSMTGWFTHHLPGAAITVEFGWSPTTYYLTHRARRGIITAMGGSFAALSTRNPKGSFEHGYAHGSTVYVSGWTLDPDMKNTALNVALYDGANRIRSAKTGDYRSDINAKYAATGRHGYHWSFAARNGTHTYCVVYANVGAGSANTRSCRTMTVNGSPRGHLDSASASATGAVDLRGWTYDPDSPAASINVRVIADGVPIGDYPADEPRSDIDSSYGISGNHGFALSIAGASVGNHTYCVTALNVGSTLASNTSLGCGQVTVPAATTSAVAPKHNPAHGSTD